MPRPSVFRATWEEAEKMSNEVKDAIRDAAFQMATVCAAWYMGWMEGVQAGAKWVFDVIFQAAI